MSALADVVVVVEATAGGGARIAAQFALGGECASHDELASRTGLSTPRVAVGLVELERSGWIERSRGVIWPR